MTFRFAILSLFFGFSAALYAGTDTEGTITGVIIDHLSQRPIEYAAVTAKNKLDGKIARSAVTNANGAFELDHLPFGEYEIGFGLLGAETPETAAAAVTARQSTASLGRLELGAGAALRMGKVEVSTRKDAFYNSIDRKVYNVGKEIQSTTGSASDLLQNVPSVQVDIEGNVSLRGDSNVLILVNGKTSTMMGKNRAAVLEQMPADGIEKIEVITNPSAKYKPDGTGGIINLTLKKKQSSGYSGNLRASAGNNGRFNASFTGNFNPGKYNVYGSASVRQDDRPRSVHDERTHPDASGAPVSTTQVTSEYSRPLSRIAQIGADYKIDESTKVGGALRYNYREFERRATVSNFTLSGPAVTQDYDRARFDPEYEKDVEFTGTVQHAFAKEDQELNVELRHGRTTEQEDNRYSNTYRTGRPPSFDNTLVENVETITEGTAEYLHPINENAKFETGYNGQTNTVDMDFHGTFFDDATKTLQTDFSKTNRFIYDATIHAAYATYARKIAQFGFLAGLRFEQALIHTDQVTAHLVDRNDYNRLYPSLHLTYNLSEAHQLQLNYSHRVHRPEGDDLNPFPQYDDPINLRAGNPHLRPEEIHSVESGYQYKNGDTTYLATLYYRHRYNGMTEVRRFVDAGTLRPNPSGAVLLTTKENLGVSRSGGAELGATTRLLDRLALNFSSNIFRNEIDASNLGFTSRQSTITWEAKLNAMFEVSRSTLLQLNTNYTAKRLTPQGYRYPTYVANIGFRHNFADKKTAFILSLSDIFNSLKEHTLVDTPTLHQEITRRRSSRILFVGFTYTFGKPTKKPKEDLQFDNAL